MQNISLESINLIVENYELSRNFYKNVLGLEVVREDALNQFCLFQLDNIQLEIVGKGPIESEIGVELTTGGGAVYMFSDSQDVDFLYQTLKEQGVSFIKEPTTQPWGQKTAYFTDPDGHIWEIQQWIGD